LRKIIKSECYWPLDQDFNSESAINESGVPTADHVVWYVVAILVQISGRVATLFHSCQKCGEYLMLWLL
jgi:hypothetical protein